MPPAPLAAALSSYGLRGRVVTMNAGRDVIGDGIVWVSGGVITHVTAATSAPPAEHAASPVRRTRGTIYPGMLEMHNHLAYNTLPFYRVPKPYTKREEWQGTAGYRRYVSGPAGVVASMPDLITATVRYVECKALVSGTTTTQGLTLRTEHITHLYRGIVRNCESPDAPDLDPVRPKIGDVLPEGRESFLSSLSGRGTRLIHLAEGLPTSAARQHFLDLRFPDGTWALGPRLAGIHATGLTADDMAILGEHGTSMVWSPFSNLALYGGTSAVRAALDAGMQVALGSDWSPTGSKNLLCELKVARILSDSSGLGLGDRELVEMVTVAPAAMMGWLRLGAIEQARYADLLVLAGTAGDAYHQLVHATEGDVRLVVIGGVARYGTPALLGSLAPADEQVAVAGKSRAFNLDTDDPDPVLGPLGLGDAIATLRDALARLPDLAAQIGSAPLGLIARGTVEGAESSDRWFLELDQPPLEGIDPALTAGIPPALADQFLGAGSYADLAVPLVLDPLATERDDAFFAMLANLANLPSEVREELPGMYGEEPHDPTDDTGTSDNDERLAPVTLAELIDGPGTLLLADRRRIVEQAIVLLDQLYVHLPLKRAMHAVDPLQRLRLLQHRLDSQDTDPPAGREHDFHRELGEIFTSLRDLHTHYVPPEPYRSHTVYLPFLVEEYSHEGARRYVVSKLAGGAELDPSFAPGVEITHWNGVPIARAVERNAELQGGSNHDARLARGLDAITIRTLGRMPPPDEDWVLLTYREDGGGERELRARWRPFPATSPFSANADDAIDADTGDDVDLTRLGALGIDAQTHTVNLVRRDLFARRWRAQAEGGPGELATSLPGVMRARIRETSIGEVGHVRIFTFLVPDPDSFVEEFVRLAGDLPRRGLILDVRGNGGGDIRAAEQLLQVLTPRPIEPEPAQFISSPLVRTLCQRSGASSPVDLGSWAPSVMQAVETGATFSSGFPISSATAANQLGQRYHGPVVLVTDARCYSATDIFSAGFQDHAIGPVLGVAGTTGAGGANVWTHSLLQQLLGDEDTPIRPLPQRTTFRVAIRRTTRVGTNAGALLEDLGVLSDERHDLSLADLMDDNADLIEAAAALIAAQPAPTLDADLQRAGDDFVVTVTADGLDRVDAFVDERPLGSGDVADQRCEFRVPHALAAGGREVRLAGFHEGRLAIARRLALTP